MKIAVVKYNAGNIYSVDYALKRLGVEATITSDKEVLMSADKVIFPGVGEAETTMSHLRKNRLDEVIKNLKQPVLGICLGMQLLFEKSYEYGEHTGLGLIPGRVVRIPDVDADGSPQRVPHISWNPLYPAGGRTDFSGTALQNVQPGQECYFIHSYEAKPAAEEYRLADTVYGGRKVCAAAQKGCVIGTQFHPEKSGPVGLGIIKAYLDLCAQAE